MLGWLVACSWARRRNRRLDEQAERQRRRAPEPLPEDEIQREIAGDQTWMQGERGYDDIDVAILLAIPVLVLIVLGLTVSAWIFWIGLLVSCGLIGFASTRA